MSPPPLIPIAGAFTCNSLDAIRTLCLAGTGIARRPRYMVNEDVQAGRLVPLLQALSARALSAFMRSGWLAIMFRPECGCSSTFFRNACSFKACHESRRSALNAIRSDATSVESKATLSPLPTHTAPGC
ncbi:hypothetical protein HP532_17015 [Pseudomonas sp. CrR25]|nr:hypothetical protein [Pseudomonas sp. CrR25]